MPVDNLTTRKAILTPYTTIVKDVKNSKIQAVGTDLKAINRTVASVTTNSIAYNILELNPSLVELVDILQDRSRTENYMNPKADMYVEKGDLKLVRYIDSKMIHTEGNAYAMYLLSTLSDRAISEVDMKKVESSQQLFDKLYVSANKHFSKIGETSLLSWTSGEDDSATDAEVFRLMALVMAKKNVDKGLWKKGSINYSKEIKKLSNDILDNSVIYFTAKDGEKFAVPTAGTNLEAPHKSNFVTETKDDYLFHYNISYSFSYAANLLAVVDDRWALINKTQNKINKEVLKNQGLRDWCVVKMNKNSGDVISSSRIHDYFPDAQKHTLINKGIEWPRFILDHALNYRDFKDKDSLDFLKLVAGRYGYDLSKLYYGGIKTGSINEITMAQGMITTLLSNKLNYDSTVDYRKEVFHSYGHYGPSNKYTFNQLIVAMTMNVVESLVANEFKKDVVASAKEVVPKDSLILRFPRTDRIWNKDIIARFDPDGLFVIEGRHHSDKDYEQVHFGSITIPKGFSKLEVEVLDIGEQRIWGDKAFSMFLNTKPVPKREFKYLYKLSDFPAPEGRKIDKNNNMIMGGINKGDIFKYSVKPGQKYQMGMIVFCNHDNNMILRFSLKK